MTRALTISVFVLASSIALPALAKGPNKAGRGWQQMQRQQQQTHRHRQMGYAWSQGQKAKTFKPKATTANSTKTNDKVVPKVPKLRDASLLQTSAKQLTTQKRIDVNKATLLGPLWSWVGSWFGGDKGSSGQ